MRGFFPNYRTNLRNMNLNTKLFTILAGLVILGAQQSSPEPKKAARAAHQAPAHDPEDRWICRIGSAHDCHCPAMMAEAQEAGVKHCADTRETRDEYVACLGKLPSNCDVIQKPDDNHPEHSCRRNCKAIAGCQCDDGPVCRRPQVWHPPQAAENGEIR
jgi:hypothetical protein